MVLQQSPQRWHMKVMVRHPFSVALYTGTDKYSVPAQESASGSFRKIFNVPGSIILVGSGTL
jgi:hypothetical protein